MIFSFALNEGLPTKGRRAREAGVCTPLRQRTLNEGLPTKGRRGLESDQDQNPHRSSLNEGLPTKGRRGLTVAQRRAVECPSTKASPRRGGEDTKALRVVFRVGPQRRPPHEGEASSGKSQVELALAAPQRRPPHEGEASHDGVRLPAPLQPSTKASPRRGGEY